MLSYPKRVTFSSSPDFFIILHHNLAKTSPSRSVTSLMNVFFLQIVEMSLIKAYIPLTNMLIDIYSSLFMFSPKKWSQKTPATTWLLHTFKLINIHNQLFTLFGILFKLKINKILELIRSRPLHSKISLMYYYISRHLKTF